MISKYKTIHVLLINVHLDCRGEGFSNRNASRDESVETGDESVEWGNESIEAEEQTQQSCYNVYSRSSSYFKSLNCQPVMAQLVDAYWL